MLWQSSINPLKKIGFVALFSGGVFVIVCAILRSTSTVKASVEDFHFVDYHTDYTPLVKGPFNGDQAARESRS